MRGAYIVCATRCLDCCVYRLRYNHLMEVGPVVRRLREARGLSQTTLARESKVSRITLNRIESGIQDPTLNTLQRIAGALQVRVRDLLPSEKRRSRR